MSTNKNAILRYNTLDKCFRSFHRRFYFEHLLEEVNNAIWNFDPKLEGIKTRQLRDDIRFMKSEDGYNAPIQTIRDGKKAYYRYEEETFSINNRPLNQSEAEQLKRAISVLQRVGGAPEFEWVNEIGPMLTTQFGLGETNKKVMSFESNIDYSGYYNILPLFNAIENNRVLKITYQPFGKEPFELTFHPYYLKQYNNRWFAFGLNEYNNIPTWNLALDRIQNIAETAGIYKPTNIDWEDHFYDIIGVTKPKDGMVSEVQLLFSPEQANYINTKPLHATQKARSLESGELLVTIKVIPNYELEMLILAFAEKVKVIAPQELKGKIKDRLLSSVNNY